MVNLYLSKIASFLITALIITTYNGSILINDSSSSMNLNSSSDSPTLPAALPTMKLDLPIDQTLMMENQESNFYSQKDIEISSEVISNNDYSKFGSPQAPTANSPPTIYSTTYVYTLTQGSFSTTIPAVEKPFSAATFYNYYSASAHTGFEKPYESKIFLYRDINTNQVSLYIIHDIDGNVYYPGIGYNSGSPDAESKMTLTGIPSVASLAQSDDPNEFRVHWPTTGQARGNWHWWYNTDGGAIKGLPTGSSWSITITPTYWKDVTNWIYHYANGSKITLDKNSSVTISYKAQTNPTTVETDEGTPITIGAFARDVDTADNPLNYQFLWNDTNAPNASSSGTTLWDTLFTATYTYYDNGIYFPELIVTDSSGATDNLTFKVIVNNVAPTVEAGVNKTVNEGSIFSLTGNFTDPGLNDTHTILWTLGDGNSSSGSLIPNHTYSNPGSYLINLTVTDDDGGVGSDNLTITVLDLIPEVDAGPGIIINEGATFSFNPSIKNPGNEPLSYFWDFNIALDGPDNDGITDNDIDSIVLRPSHMYLDHGFYNAKITVMDDEGNIVSDTVNIMVFDLAPDAQFTWAPNGQFEGSPVQFSDLSFSYPDDIVTWYWIFGDGSTSTAQHPTHTYLDNGNYSVRLSVIDDDGSTSWILHHVVIQNADPIADAGADKEGFEVSTFNFVGSCYDPGIYDTHTYEWDFDYDGSNFDADAIGQGVSHTWTDDFDGYVAVRVTDNDGGIGIDTTHVLVKNAAPSVRLNVLPVMVNITIRIAGEKWHDVSAEVYEDNIKIAKGTLTRYPGSPNVQMLQLSTISMNLSRMYSMTIRYTPEDDPKNGQINGATPCWVIFDEAEKPGLQLGASTLHHTFNVKHPDTYVWNVNLTKKIHINNVTFEGFAHDAGADDLTFYWDFGDGSNITHGFPNLNNTNPFEVLDRITHIFPSYGTFTIKLTVKDDDGGETSVQIVIHTG